MPTEAEWEYAARAGTTTATYNGELTTMDCSEESPVQEPIVDYCGSGSGGSVPVGQKQPNPWNLYDMLGNLWEWVDGRCSDTELPSAGLDPRSSCGTRFMARGGGYAMFNFTGLPRAATQNAISERENFHTGFRVVRTHWPSN